MFLQLKRVKAWIEENSHNGPLISGADAWSQEFRSEGTRWAAEYTGKSDRELEEDALESAWKGSSVCWHARAHILSGVSEDSQFEDAWSQATGGGRQRNLKELTDAITRIDDPKLQRSSFMQFMHKINKGQVSFADNKVYTVCYYYVHHIWLQVIEHDHVDNGWASEYQGLEREFNQNDWAREFEDFRTTVGGDWARDYEGFSGAMLDPNKLSEYEFALNQASNPYYEQEGSFEEGINLFKQVRSVQLATTPLTRVRA